MLCIWCDRQDLRSGWHLKSIRYILCAMCTIIYWLELNWFYLRNRIQIYKGILDVNNKFDVLSGGWVLCEGFPTLLFIVRIMLIVTFYLSFSINEAHIYLLRKHVFFFQSVYAKLNEKKVRVLKKHLKEMFLCSR